MARTGRYKALKSFQVGAQRYTPGDVVEESSMSAETLKGLVENGQVEDTLPQPEPVREMEGVDQATHEDETGSTMTGEDQPAEDDDKPPTRRTHKRT